MPAVKPYSLRNTFTHPLARMFPFFRYQKQVYRLAEKIPPAGGMVDHAPSWETVTVALPALGTQQLRVNVQRDFWLLGLTTSFDEAIGVVQGFRAQFYDTIKKVRFADRGVRNNLIAGNGSNPVFLRDPYHFDQPNSQILVILQNLDNAASTVQVAFYGQVLRFNQ